MKTFTVVIETPRGSVLKYNYNEKVNGYLLAKIMPTGVTFTYDFGFVPGTKGSGCDPLDVIVILLVIISIIICLPTKVAI